MEIPIVTGLSGAGKSRVVDALEDIGYFCVDNMPPKLMPTFAQLLLNVEAFRRFNIFEVDTAKGRFQRRHNINEFIGIELVHFDIENVDTGKFLEQNALTFHDRFTGQRADIP